MRTPLAAIAVLAAPLRNRDSLVLIAAALFTWVMLADLREGPLGFERAIIATTVLDYAGRAILALAVIRAARATRLRAWRSGITRATWLALAMSSVLISSLLLRSYLLGSDSQVVSLVIFNVVTTLILAAWWVAEAGIWLFAGLRENVPAGTGVRLFMPIALFIAAVAAATSTTPSQLAYLVSRVAMDDFAASAVAPSTQLPATGEPDLLEGFPARLGILRIERVERYSGGLNFFVAGGLDMEGFAYTGSGRPPGDLSVSYVQWSKHWWRWNRGFD